MRPPNADRPPAVDDIEAYWGEPPPEPSPRLLYWQQKIADGWRANRHISGEGYYSSAQWFGVYLWVLRLTRAVSK